MKKFHSVLWLMLTGLVFSSLHSAAQGREGFIMNYGKFTDNAQTCVYTETAPVYSSNSTDASIIATLKLGTPVTVVSNSDEDKQKINGYSACWCSVKFSLNGTEGKGYMWGGHLAVACIKDPGQSDDLYIYGISAYDSSKYQYDAKIKYLKNGALVSFTDVDVVSAGWFGPGEYGYCIGGEMFGKHGFAGVDQILRLEFRYEACGYENTDKYIFRCGDKLSEEIVSTNVSEAGVFHFESDVIFPGAKNSIPNTVVKTGKSSEFDEARKDYVLKEKKVEKYVWDPKIKKMILKK